MDASWFVWLLSMLFNTVVDLHFAVSTICDDDIAMYPSASDQNICTWAGGEGDEAQNLIKYV